jgi:hypothetical protein
MRHLVVLSLLAVAPFALAVLGARQLVPAALLRADEPPRWMCAEYWDEQPEHPPVLQCWQGWGARRDRSTLLVRTAGGRPAAR